MGLFTFLNKNKQEGAVEDSGYYARADDSAVAAHARSKRASNAGEAAKRGKEGRAGADPVLPEKKRARRRLVGAIALALAVAVGLPMLLDSEPPPPADIAILIPTKDKPPAPLATVAPGGAAVKVTLTDGPDPRGEGTDTPGRLVPPTAVALAMTATPPVLGGAKAEAKSARHEAKPDPDALSAPEPKAHEAQPEQKATVKAANPKAEEKPAPAQARPPARLDEKATALLAKAGAKADEGAAAQLARAGAKAEEKSVQLAKTGAKADDKLAPKAPDAGDEVRALSILEGKPAAAVGGKFVVQVAALATQDKVAELQDKLKEAGIKSYTQKVPTQAGERTRVRVGPLSREEAEKVRAKLARLGLSGTLVPT